MKVYMGYRVALSILLSMCCLVALVFVDSFVFFMGGGALLWLVGFFCVQRESFVAKFYWLIFGVFFIVPIAVLGGESYVYYGAFLKSIQLAQDEVLLFSELIFLFLASFLLASFLCPEPVGRKVEFVYIKNTRWFGFFLSASALVVIGFNLVEMNAIYNQGYSSLYMGEVDVKKGFLVLLVEVFFFVLMALGVSFRDKRSFAFLIAYAMTSMLTGVRMPGATLAFFGVLYFFPYWRRHFVAVIVLMLVFAPPLLMLTQALRVYGYSAFEYFDIWHGYYDLINVLGYTVDTLKAAISIGDEQEFIVSPFFKPLHVLSIFLDRVFQVEFRFEYGSFGPEFTKYYALELYEQAGVTFGSSSIAEAWYYWRYFGVALLGIISFVFATYFSRMAYRNSFVGALVFLVVVPKFIMSVRNEVLGWLFESLIFLALCIPFIIVCYLFFLKKSPGLTKVEVVL